MNKARFFNYPVIVIALVTATLFCISQIELWKIASQEAISWENGYPTYHQEVIYAEAAIWAEVLFLGVPAFYAAACWLGAKIFRLKV